MWDFSHLSCSAGNSAARAYRSLSQPAQGNGAIGDEQQESDMEREHQIETTELTELNDKELEAVNGGGYRFLWVTGVSNGYSISGYATTATDGRG
jgi:bacteriocin-like protein